MALSGLSKSFDVKTGRWEVVPRVPKGHYSYAASSSSSNSKQPDDRKVKNYKGVTLTEVASSGGSEPKKDEKAEAEKAAAAAAAVQLSKHSNTRS